MRVIGTLLCATRSRVVHVLGRWLAVTIRWLVLLRPVCWLRISSVVLARSILWLALVRKWSDGRMLRRVGIVATGSISSGVAMLILDPRLVRKNIRIGCQGITDIVVGDRGCGRDGWR
jgi:hypothetical protein